MVRSACSNSETVAAGCDVRVPITRLKRAVFTELEIMSCCALSSWDSATWASTLTRSTAVRVPLRGLHFAQTGLVSL